MRDQSVRVVALLIVVLGSIFFVAGTGFRLGLYRPETWVKPFQEGRLPLIQRQLAFSMAPAGGAVIAAALAVVITITTAQLVLVGLAIVLVSLAVFIWHTQPGWAQPSWVRTAATHPDSMQVGSIGESWIWLVLTLVCIVVGACLFLVLGNSLEFDAVLATGIGSGIGAFLSSRRRAAHRSGEE
jgi:hypothetical protein